MTLADFSSAFVEKKGKQRAKKRNKTRVAMVTTHNNVKSSLISLEKMDDVKTGPKFLQDLLSELSNNLKTAATVLSNSNNEDYSELVKQMQNVKTEEQNVDHEQQGVQSSPHWQSFSRHVRSFVEIQLDMLKNGQFAPHVINLGKKRQENQREICNLSQNLLEKKNQFEKAEATHLHERAQRCQIVEDLQMRIDDLKKQTKWHLHMAKNCGQESRLELIKNHQKPLEMRQLKFQLLENNLENLLRETNYVRGQLTQCSAELRAQFESLQSSYTKEMKAKTDKFLQLSRKLEWMRNSHRVFTAEYGKITAYYLVIVEKKKQEDEVLKRKQEEERRREHAAFKIQRWFRFLLFRRRLKKSRKSRKKKNVKSDKPNELLDSRKTAISDGQQLVQKSAPGSKKTSAVKITTSSGRKSLVKNNRSDEIDQNEPKVEIKDKSSQTDGRVPKTKLLF